MRCYFLLNGHISGVEALDPSQGDEGCITRAHALFEVRKGKVAGDGFEVWDQKRLVFRHPQDLKTPNRPA